MVGVDIREQSIRRAELVRDYLGVDAGSWRCGPRTRSPWTPRSSAASTSSCALGSIYHVEHPMGVLRLARALTRGLCVIESQTARAETPVLFGFGSRQAFEATDAVIAVHHEADQGTNPLASAGGVLSFCPNPAALRLMAATAGFRDVQGVSRARSTTRTSTPATARCCSRARGELAPGQAMPATVLTHVHNEELLLPYWLAHHRELFDHGVIVDRGSTDRTVEIVRELVPDWELVASRNSLFDARDTDLEMMGLERRYGGWKIVLNATEFLLHDDLRGHLDRIERSSPETRAIGIRMLPMVDAPGEHGRRLDDRALFLQRRHHVPDALGGPQFRYLHRLPHGDYGAGRHAVRTSFSADRELVVLKYMLSPYPQVRARRLAIAGAIPDADIRLGMSWALFFTGEELDEQFAALSPAARDIAEDPAVAATLERLRRGYARRPRNDVPRLEPDSRRRVSVVSADPGAACAGDLPDALAVRHEVRSGAAAEADAAESFAWAEIVVADAAAYEQKPAVQAAQRALVLDLSATDPGRAGEQMLLRGDFFLWAPASEAAWVRRLASLGRIADRAPYRPRRVAAARGGGPGAARGGGAGRPARAVSPRASPHHRARRPRLDPPRVARGVLPASEGRRRRRSRRDVRDRSRRQRECRAALGDRAPAR